MAITNWKNLPDTSTPLNADNLNKRDIIRIDLNGNYTVQSSAIIEVPLNRIAYQVGSELTFKNNKVYVSNKVKTVKISGAVTYVPSSTGVKSSYFTKDPGNTVCFAEVYATNNNTYFRGVVSDYIYTDLKENDYIYLRSQCAINDIISQGRTYMTIEVIEYYD